MITILATIFLITSFMGYSSFLKEKYIIETGFIPFIIFTTYISSIYIFALLGLMQASTVIFNLIGLFLLINSVKNKFDFKSLLPEYIIFFVFVTFFAIYLRDNLSYAYDDFSHWGVISRFLVEKDALNTVLDTNVSYTSYPQATAYFSYGIVNFIGYTEGRILISNAILLYSGLFTFVSVLKKNILGLVTFLALTYFGLLYNIRLFSLSVDSIIAVTSFAILAYKLFYNNADDSNKNFFLVPMFISIVLVKHSAILLVIFIIIVFCILGKIKDKWNIFYILSVLFAFISWKIHVNREFPKNYKHDISISAYKSIFAEKSKDNIIEAFNTLINKMINDKLFWAFILILLVLFIVHNMDRIIRNMIIINIIYYLIYQIGLYLTYVFSMSTSELLRFASYDRYNRTIHLFLILGSVYFYLKMYPKSKYFNILISIFFVLSVQVSEPVIRLDQKGIETRRLLQKKKDELGDVSGKNILMNFREDDYTRYYLRMSMFTFDRATIKETYEGSDEEIDLSEYDYIINERDLK